MVSTVGLSPDLGFPSVFDAGALVSGCDHFCIYLSAARTHGGGGSGRASGGKACFSSIDRGTRGPSGVCLVVFTGVGASGEDIFQVPLERLVPEVPLSRGYLAVVFLLFTGPTARRGAVFGRLLAPLADAFARSMISRHSAALWRPYGCIGHGPLPLFCGRGRLLRSPWPLVTAVATRAVDRGLW
jgi:hypothetical protein